METRRKKLIWVSPWGYTEGWLLCAGLLITGLLLQLTIGGLSSGALSWPINIIFATTFTVALVIGWVFFKKNNMINWLSRVPAAITSIVFVTFLVLIMGFTLQVDSENPVWVQKLGLSNMTNSWPFLFGIVFFLAALGMATLKRITPFKGRNIGFFLNHAGLYIAILAGIAGAPDLKRLTMELHHDSIVWVSMDRQGHLYEMPLAMQLVSFNMEEYNPKVAIIESRTGRIVPEGLKDIFEISKGNVGSILDWQVEVKEFYSLSGRFGERFEPVMDWGAAPAALMKVTDPDGNITEGWITCGSFMYPHQLLELDDNLSLAMTIPQASHYSSDVIIYTEDGDVIETRIEVNKPVSAQGWKLYQYSYDDRFGRYSSTSIIEAIRDPWLPVVYTGIFMLIAGSVYLMTLGKAPENQEGDLS